MPSLVAISPRPLSSPPLFSMRLLTPTRASLTTRGLIVRVQLMTPFWNGAMLKLLYRNGARFTPGVSWRPFE